MIYHLLDEVAELMAGHAPRIKEQLDLGSATVLQVFPLKKGSKYALPSLSLPLHSPTLYHLTAIHTFAHR